MPSVTPDGKILFTLVYIVKDGKTLMLHRVKKKNDIHQDKYNGLGGKFEAGESPLECCIREVKEESGLDVKKAFFKGHLLFPKFDGENDWMTFVYRVDEFDGEINQDCVEGNLIWIDNDKLTDLPLWEGDKIFLKYMFKSEIFDGVFHYENGKLVEHKLSFLNS
ncbi:MAG: 8-oxo-dGTP diphosphatase [Deltaproteobacteria bacterium]|nr:MAG: 8-oxo-dGTP diphosphatase [Deltaproteobacteria bacterium]